MKNIKKIFTIICIFITSIVFCSSCSNVSSSSSINYEEKQKIVDYISLKCGDEESFILDEIKSMVTSRLGYVDDKFVISIKYVDDNRNCLTQVTFDYMDKQLDCSNFIYENENEVPFLTCKLNTYKHQYYGYDKSTLKVINSSYIRENETLQDIINAMDGWLVYSFIAFEELIKSASLPYCY